MSKQLTIDLDDDLYERTQLVADNRGISIQQLITQQLERATAQEEYLRLQQLAAQRQSAKIAKPPQRAQKKRSSPVSPRTQMHKNART